MGSFKLYDGDVLLPNGNKVSLRYPVAELLEFSNYSVVRFDVPIDDVYNENVLAIGVDGNLIWQIKSRKYIYDNSPYMRIVKEGENVAAHNWDGLVMVLCSKTGRVVEKRQTK